MWTEKLDYWIDDKATSRVMSGINKKKVYGQEISWMKNQQKWGTRYIFMSVWEEKMQRVNNDYC